MLLTQVLPKFVGFLDARLAAAPGGGPFYLGAALSIADLAVFSLVNGISSGSWDHIPGDYVAARWPRLSAHAAAVAAHPLVVAHGALSA